MPEVTIVCDSIACLTRELVEQYGIDIVPLNFYCGGKVYRDWVDTTPTQAYELFLKDPESFKTSPASPEDCLKVFRVASKKARSILCITVSVKLSTLFNMAQTAAELAKTEFPKTSIAVLDSETATAAEGFVVLAAARTVAAGKSLKEAAQAAEAIKGRLGTIILLDTMRHVYRSGRVPKIAAQAASMLNIRPLFTISSGVVHFVGATRNRKRGIEHLLNTMRNKVKQSPVHVAVMHAYALDDAERLKERVSSEFDCVEIWISEFSPLMGYACGTGTLGLAFYADSGSAP